MNFIVAFFILLGVQISMVVGQNGILTQAENAATLNQSAIVEEQIEMAVFAETSTYLQNNVIDGGDTSSEALAEYMSQQMNDSSSVFFTSLPEGYYITSVSIEEGTKVRFSVIVAGVTYDAVFDAETQTTTFE